MARAAARHMVTTRSTGSTGSATATVRLGEVRVPASRRPGAQGSGLLTVADQESGRLGGYP